MVKWLGWIVVLALAGAAGYEVALALGAQSLGALPGEDAPGATAARVVAAAAMLVGGGLALASVRLPLPAGPWVAPAAAAFVVPLYFTFDPYYAPNERRYSDGGIFPLEWIVAVAAAALLAGLVTRFFPRLGGAATALVLVVLLFTDWFVGVGH